MPELGKWLVALGLVIAGVGVALWLGIGKSWLGRLPGDIRIERDGLSFYFPVATCLVISLILTLLSLIFRSLGR